MYRPKYTIEDRPEVLLRVMRENAFAVLMTAGEGGAIGEATHLPVIVRERAGGVIALEMHVARPNRVWEKTGEGREALVVFSGPHAYISPAWYVNRETVPTWNYVAVHAYGPTERMEGDELRAHLDELVEVNERAAGTGWSLEATPEKYLAGLRHGVVGIRLVVNRLEGKVKMGQNRAAEDREGAIAGLRGTGGAGDAAVAEWMVGAGQDEVDE